LDAPAVAVVWQALTAHGASAPLRFHHVFLLASSVWLSYTADRWIEGWRLSPATVRTQRHYFAMRWRWPLFAVWVAMMAVSIAIAIRSLTRAEWTACLGLLAPTLAYLLSHQFIHRGARFRLPKEVCVAGHLAAGAGVFPAASDTARVAALCLSVALFFVLAFANCALISEWEREVDRAQQQVSLAQNERLNRRLARGALALAGIAGAVILVENISGARPLGAAAVMSAAALAAVSAATPRWGRERSRVLADVALMTPLLVFLVR
jgi:hypothetical protein